MCSNYKLQIFRFELCSFSLLGARLTRTDLVFGILLSNYCSFYTCCEMFKKQKVFNKSCLKLIFLVLGPQLLNLLSSVLKAYCVLYRQ